MSYVNELSQQERNIDMFPTATACLQKIGVDLFNWNNKKFFVVVDYYSKYNKIAEMSKTIGVLVIGKLKRIFARHGIPSEIFTGNGPPFNSYEFTNFRKEYGLRHIKPKCILPTPDLYLALLAYHATKHSTKDFHLLSCHLVDHFEQQFLI